MRKTILDLFIEEAENMPYRVSPDEQAMFMSCRPNLSPLFEEDAAEIWEWQNQWLLAAQ